MEIMDPTSGNTDLFLALEALLMLIPQTEGAFEPLRKRLNSAYEARNCHA